MAITMVFDIETIPDVMAGRRLLGLEDALSDSAVADALISRRLEQSHGNSSFLPHHLQRIVAISVVVSTPEWVKVWSLGDLESNEQTLISRFFEGIQKYTPVLVSWNGSGFDLPVLHYRSLIQGVIAGRYWETGDMDSGFRWNNYLSRYHARHTDLMEVLSGYQSRAYAPLEEVALMLGLPGKMGMQGSVVWENYQAGNVQSIRDYCETDVLNTYLIFLRFQLIRGHLNAEEIEYEHTRLRTYLLNSAKPHLLAFLEAWGV